MKTLRTSFLCFLLLGFVAAHAGGIDFLHDKKWKEILAQAKTENKLIFLDAYATWCGPCKRMQSDVFTDVAVSYYYNKNFINVKIDMEKGEGVQLARELGIRSYPTLLYITGDGKVVHKRIGAMEASEFLQLGEDARNPGRQFYTIREKAMTGKLETEVFHQWIHEAGDLEEDVDSVIISYLQKTKNPVMEKEMLSIMLDHAPLNKDQIAFLFKNKEACLKETGRTPEAFNAAMQARVTVYATNESLKNDVFDFPKFQKIVQAYYPAEAPVLTKKMKIRFYSYQGDYKKSLDELADCITSQELQLKADEWSELVIQNIKTITSQQRIDEFINKVSQCKLSASESSKGYRKDLALFVLNYCKDDMSSMKTYSEKILKDSNAPEDIKAKVKDILEEAEGK